MMNHKQTWEDLHFLAKALPKEFLHRVGQGVNNGLKIAGCLWKNVDVPKHYSELCWQNIVIGLFQMQNLNFVFVLAQEKFRMLAKHYMDKIHNKMENSNVLSYHKQKHQNKQKGAC